jgi:hypothetical protein
VWLLARRGGWGKRLIMLAPIWAMALAWTIVWILIGEFDLASGVMFATLVIVWLTVWLLFAARRHRARGN